MCPSKIAVCTLIIALLVSSMTLVESAYAQTRPEKPSIPEFTLRVDYNSQYFEDSKVILTVKNQPSDFTIDGDTYQIYYVINKKMHSDTEWTQLGSYYARDVVSDKRYLVIAKDTVRQRDGEYTTFTFNEKWNQSGVTMDFQVQALLGHNISIYDPYNAGLGMALGVPGSRPTSDYFPAVAYDVRSGWSEVQSITITKPPTPTATPYTTPKPTAQSRFDWTWTWETTATVLGSIIALLLGVIIALLFYIIKTRIHKQKFSSQ